MYRRRMMIRRLLFGLLVVAVLCAVGVWLFAPRPILEDPDAVKNVRVVYNPYGDQNAGDPVEVTDFDAAGVLDCLSRYKARRTLSRAKGYWFGDVELEIILVSADGAKEILLGNLNYVSGGYGTYKHQIVDAGALLSELKHCLKLS